ncbi:hypothetical protein LOTGIDRAFT_168169 [Lottia gigantea]|uniref:EF-hand domain-containing protein n=1 Tax=Lottia gigantea TaxID=225164 RepID=V3ZKW8_LOTGI|nr:hypothetical protein LOTGIDRAFT_168169 [Lottia gigantea]ESO84912.1 hypothetical protein LOTGIDRAFT_168169 [Lottia gigantea]
MAILHFILQTFLLCSVIYETFGVMSFNDMKRDIFMKIPLNDRKAIFLQRVPVDFNKDGYVDNYEVERLLGQYWTPEDIDFFLSHCEAIGEDEGISVHEFYMSIKVFSGFFRPCGEGSLCPVKVTPKVTKKVTPKVKKEL